MKIGEINGGWSVLMRVNQVLIPVALTSVIALCVWMTKSINDHEKQLAVFDEWKAGRMAAWIAIDMRVSKAEVTLDRMQDETANEKLSLGNKLNDLSTEIRLLKDQMDRLTKAVEKHINKEEKSVSFVP